jgi:hypothetical protein
VALSRKCCKLPASAKGKEWNVVVREMLEWQTEEKFRRALQRSAGDSAKSETVLIVDDDEEIRLIAEYTLQQMGYRPESPACTATIASLRSAASAKSSASAQCPASAF